MITCIVIVISTQVMLTAGSLQRPVISYQLLHQMHDHQLTRDQSSLHNGQPLANV